MSERPSNREIWHIYDTGRAGTDFAWLSGGRTGEKARHYSYFAGDQGE